MGNQIEIKKKKLLLAEGADAYFFCIWACQGFGANDIQVLDFKGVNELGLYLRQLVLAPRFDIVESIVIARDAESNASEAVQSVQSALKNAKLPDPKSPFDFTDGMPKTAFILFPGFSELEDGTLEDLCLAMVDEDPTLKCVNEYIACVKGVGEEIKQDKD